MVVLLALLNDLPIMMIAYDNAPIAPSPVRWDMARVLTIATLLGTYGVIESFGMFWIVARLSGATSSGRTGTDVSEAPGFRTYDDLSDPQRRSDLGAPLAKLEACRALRDHPTFGTLIVVYGLFMTPTGWRYALMVWGYTIVSFLIANAVKIGGYRLLDYRAVRQTRHLRLVEGRIAS